VVAERLLFMTLKQYLTVMILGTIMCWIAWGFVIFNIDPFQDTGVGLFFFYISLFFALLGTLSILAFTLRRFFSKLEQPMFRYVQKSFCDSLIISIALILLLFLQAKQYLNWWNTGIFVLVIFLVLAFILSTKKHQAIN